MNNIYKEEKDRKTLSIPSIDQYILENNQVRAIDAYVESLDMVELDFTNATLSSTDGQPAFHPKLLLKIYIYGYLNRIRSSRKLEVEVKRNIEMIWLCGGLRPSYKTIANFRKDNSKALEEVFKEFTLLCKNLDLITGELTAVDGAFLRANASKNQLIMKKSVEKDLKKIEEKIEIDFKKLQFTEKNPNNNENMLKPPTVIKLLKINKRKEKLEKDLDFLEKNNLTQYNRTDPDAKLMVKPAHNLMAYNVQIAVDGKYKFIVATDISSVGQDTNQLYNMASKSKDVLGQEKMNIIADKGYYNTNEIKKCIDNNITPFLSTPKYKQPKGELFTADKFEYDEEKDCYRCPNNQELTKASFTQDRGGRTNSVYQGSASKCKNCPLREKCIPAKTACKRIYRWEHQKMLEQHQSKMETDKAKEIIKKRGSIVEHPFGTIKQTLGWTHFLVRGKVKVTGENALIMFTYNFRRLINLIGIALFKKVLKALKNGNIEAIKAEIVAYIAMLLHIWVYFLGRIKFYSYKEEKLSFRLRDTPFEHLLRFS